MASHLNILQIDNMYFFTNTCGFVIPRIRAQHSSTYIMGYQIY